MKIKNWSEFQHFKDRCPPWIKLHRRILDQRDINLISDRAFRALIGLWLLASESRTMDGTLPPIPDIAFRLRIKEDALKSCISELSEFLLQDDIDLISDGYQVDVNLMNQRRGETETETETECRADPTVSLKKGAKEKIPFADIVGHLNKKTGSFFKHDTEPTRKQIRSLFRQGFTADDFFTVINHKASEWMADPKMSQYLRPQTLFSTKFES